jgi:steroid delta-isomerase-like uncharacterized protein
LKESNQALAIRWFDQVWNQRSDDTVRELLHRDGVGHLEGMDVRGPEEFLAARAAILGAFPNLRVTVDATACDGPDVVVRWSAQGTHRGDGLGIPATLRQTSFQGITWLRFSEGQIVEGWDRWNVGHLLQELQASAQASRPPDALTS